VNDLCSAEIKAKTSIIATYVSCKIYMLSVLAKWRLQHTRLLQYRNQMLDRRTHKYTIHKIRTWS